MSPNFTLYAALLFYTAGTLIALASLFTRERRTQHAALVLMIGGFLCHTTWIGTICARTHHPPLTNLPEAAAFVAWCIFVVELALFIRYRTRMVDRYLLLDLSILLLSASLALKELVLDPTMAAHPPIGLSPNLSADYLLMRAVGDPDVLLASDLGVRHAAAALDIEISDNRPDLAPWRSYVTHQLWASL